MWDSFVAVLRKEFMHILRDRGTLMVAMTIPLFQLMLFGFIDQTVHEPADGRGRPGPVRATAAS